MRWSERRRRMYRLIAEAFSARTGISRGDFERIYLETDNPSSIGDFETQYIPDRETLSGILENLGRSSGVGADKAAAHYDRAESFAQYAEHLLRVTPPQAGEDG